jgi:hypothetical protein
VLIGSWVDFQFSQPINRRLPILLYIVAEQDHRLEEREILMMGESLGWSGITRDIGQHSTKLLLFPSFRQSCEQANLIDCTASLPTSPRLKKKVHNHSPPPRYPSQSSF